MIPADEDRTGKPWEPFEDDVIRENAGKVSADRMAAILRRPINGVHHRVKRLGLSGHLHGEHHWAAKITGLQAAMIGALRDAGFSALEIKRAFNLDLTTDALDDIGACRTWRGQLSQEDRPRGMA